MDPMSGGGKRKNEWRREGKKQKHLYMYSDFDISLD